MSTTLLQDTFKIHDVNPDGTKFDKVTRIVCKESQRHSFKMVLDLYTELYDVKKSEKLDLVLATDKTLIDDYDYVMFGRVFKYHPDEDNTKVSFTASFGGLLLKLTSDPLLVTNIEPDMNLYMLIRKEN